VEAVSNPPALPSIIKINDSEFDMQEFIRTILNVQGPNRTYDFYMPREHYEELLQKSHVFPLFNIKIVNRRDGWQWGIKRIGLKVGRYQWDAYLREESVRWIL
jgi:hypothetical protein